MTRKPKHPDALVKAASPDITFNPTNKSIPYSTRSATAARRIAREGGQKPAANHR